MLGPRRDEESLISGDNLWRRTDTTISGGPIGGCGPEITEIPPGRPVGDVEFRGNPPPDEGRSSGKCVCGKLSKGGGKQRTPGPPLSHTQNDRHVVTKQQVAQPQRPR